MKETVAGQKVLRSRTRKQQGTEFNRNGNVDVEIVLEWWIFMFFLLKTILSNEVTNIPMFRCTQSVHSSKFNLLKSCEFNLNCRESSGLYFKI